MVVIFLSRFFLFHLNRVHVTANVKREHCTSKARFESTLLRGCKARRRASKRARAKVGANLAREGNGGANRVDVDVDGIFDRARVTASHDGCNGHIEVRAHRKQQPIAASETVLAQ